jgi:Putative MetA-pathway of phenol degradation
LAGALLLTAFSASAQTVTPPLTSNRPGIADSEALVGRGVIQIEGGIQAQDAPPGGDRAWTQTWGQLTIRVGVRPRIEIFAGWDGLSLDRVSANGESRFVAGGNDLRLGTKLAVLSEDRHAWTLTVAPAWSFPVGSEAFTSSSNDGSFRVLWARSLPRDWSVSGNVLFTRTSDEAGRYWDNAAMVGVTRALTSTVSAFAEVSGVLLAERPDAWTLDAGVAWVARPNLQWDVSAGHTFDHRAEDWFVSAGITVRRR